MPVNSVDPITHTGQRGVGEDGLTAQRREFADHFIRLVMDGEQYPKRAAALAAGYAESHAAKAAWELLRHPAVISYIGDQLSAATAPVKVDHQFIAFKLVLAVEMAEAQGNVHGMNRALEILGKMTSVGAFMRGNGLPDPDGAGGGFIAGDLSLLDDDELLAARAIAAKLSRRPIG